MKTVLDEEKEPILTCHREDAYNQVKKRSKFQNELSVNNCKIDRQNVVKSNQNTVKKPNNCINNRNMSSKVKHLNSNSNNLNEFKKIVRRSPRSPIPVNKTTRPKKIDDKPHKNMSGTNHLRSSRSRTISNSIPIGNGSESSIPNALKRSR